MREVWWIPLLPAALIACGAGIDKPVASCNLGAQMADAKGQEGSGALVLLACPVGWEAELEGPIRVTVGIGNVSDSTVRIRPSLVFGAWLDARIEDPLGDAPDRAVHIDAGLGPPTNLSPGEIFEETIDLTCAVGGPASPGGCGAPYRFTRPGEYVFEMRYSYPCDFQPCEPGKLYIDQIVAKEFTILLR